MWRNHVLNSKEDLNAFTRKLTDDAGVDVVFDAVGSESTVNLGVEIVQLGGKVVWVGLVQPQIHFEYKHAVVKEIVFPGCLPLRNRNGRRTATARIRETGYWKNHYL